MFLISLFVAGEAFQPQMNQSRAADVDVSANIEPVAILRVPETFIDVGDAKVATTELNTRDFATYVSTNNQTGYTLSVNTKTIQQCLRRPENQATTCSSLVDRNRIMQLASAATPVDNFPSNYWGLSVDESFEYYSPVPVNLANAWKFKATSSSAIEDETIIRAGVKVDFSKAPGVYSNDIVISVVVNPLPIPIITSVVPSYGFPGDTITIGGVYFDLLHSVDIANFRCEDVEVDTDILATCVVPPGYGPNLRLTTMSIFGDTNLNTPYFGYQEDFKFTIDTRMTDTLFAEGDTIDTNPTHFSGTDTEYTVSAARCSTFYEGNISYNCSNYRAYSWLIDWGDGSPIQAVSGIGDSSGGISSVPPPTGSSIPHDYGIPGEYQIRIMSNGQATSGWLDRFGPGNSGTQANKNMFKSIDSPLPRLASGRTDSMFNGLRNAVSLPAFLLDDNSIASFYSMFAYYSYNNTAATIPSGFLDKIGLVVNNTSQGAYMNRAFQYSFQYYGYNSTIGTIPPGLFDYVNTASVTTSQSMFTSTFAYCFYNSPVATIPKGLFDTISFPNGGVMNSTFTRTFSNYAYNSTSGFIPEGFLSFIDFTTYRNATSFFNGMFENFAYMNNTPSSDISLVWGDANLAGAITAANASSMLSSTFRNVRSLTGSAQTFINNYLGGINPSSRAYTFDGTQVIDLASLHANWK